MQRHIRVQSSLAVALVVCGGLWGYAQRGEAPAEPKGQLSKLKAEPELAWPVPAAAKQYASIDGKHLKGYVEELAAIARKQRDGGTKWWGRIAGTSSGLETQQWLATRFKQAGLEVRTDEYEMRPQTFPQSWVVRVAGSGKTLALSSAFPYFSFGQLAPSPGGAMDLESVWVGLGMASDFLGRDVRGKAVYLYSIPTPSSLIQSEGWMGAAQRAQEAGAKALIVIVAIPGNIQFASHLDGLSAGGNQLPVFTLGLDDGQAVESLIAAGGGKAQTHLEWKVKTFTGLKAANIIGVLPGQTDENIVVISHTDGFFEGANDNAAGTAAMMGVAEYFAKVPKAQRRRTMYFIATPDHHGGDQGAARIHANMQSILAKAAAVLNSEHVAVFEPIVDRPWGSRVQPSLYASNQIGPSWWGVNGSPQMATIIRDTFAMFGVPTHIEQGGSPGELRAVQWDAPSFYLHNKGIYYHASNDVVSVIPATGLRTATQSFARIFDELNKLDLEALRPAPVPAPTARR